MGSALSDSDNESDDQIASAFVELPQDARKRNVEYKGKGGGEILDKMMQESECREEKAKLRAEMARWQKAAETQVGERWWRGEV